MRCLVLVTARMSVMPVSGFSRTYDVDCYARVVDSSFWGSRMCNCTAIQNSWALFQSEDLYL